jgi:hypothetical protein
MVTFAGKEQVNLYVIVTLKHGLKLYAKTGMKPNSAWTPAAMLKRASSFTGKAYKRGQYQAAIDDLEALLPKNG